MQHIHMELITPGEETIKALEELMHLIDGELVIKEEPYLNRSIVTLTYDSESIEKKLNRKVGRKKKPVVQGDLKDLASVEVGISLEQLEKMIKERGSAQTAADLHISRATLFRKLKKARENGVDFVI